MLIWCSINILYHWRLKIAKYFGGNRDTLNFYFSGFFNRRFKRKAEIEILYNIVNVYLVTFNQFNVLSESKYTFLSFFHNFLY